MMEKNDIGVNTLESQHNLTAGMTEDGVISFSISECCTCRHILLSHRRCTR